MNVVKCLYIVYSWLLNNMGVKGINSPCNQKSRYNSQPAFHVLRFIQPRIMYYHSTDLVKKICIYVDPCNSNLCCSRVNCTLKLIRFYYIYRKIGESTGNLQAAVWKMISTEISKRSTTRCICSNLNHLIFFFKNQIQNKTLKSRKRK